MSFSFWFLYFSNFSDVSFGSFMSSISVLKNNPLLGLSIFSFISSTSVIARFFYDAAFKALSDGFSICTCSVGACQFEVFLVLGVMSDFLLKLEPSEYHVQSFWILAEPSVSTASCYCVSSGGTSTSAPPNN